MKKKLYDAGIIICVCVMLLSGFMIGRYYTMDKRHTDEFKDLAEIVEHERAEENSKEEEAAEITYEKGMPEYNSLYLENNDIAGWIKIEGTTIDYPVMYTPDAPDYYLKRDFNKQYSDYGTPYIDAYCDVFPQGDNIIIYGHHILNGKMFGALRDYENASFYKEHSILKFDTLAEHGEYVIFAIFETVANSDRGFAYHNFVNAADEDEFEAYVSKCKELSLYETGVTAKYGDKLLTLSTCEYFNQDGRLVVVAKKIED